MDEDDTFLGGIMPLTVQCSNGGSVYVTVNVIRRDKDHDSLRWMADLIDNKPIISKEIHVFEQKT